jgi:hypothetical protein
MLEKSFKKLSALSQKVDLGLSKSSKRMFEDGFSN